MFEKERIEELEQQVEKLNMNKKEILKARCNNCESSYRQYGKLCPWRSISGDYCFDGMNTEEAHREIKKHFDDFQTKIAHRTQCPFAVRDLSQDECYSGNGQNRCKYFVKYDDGTE